MFKGIFNKISHVIAVIIVTLMCITIFISIPVTAETGIDIFEYDGYKVEYNVVNEWDGYQNIEIKLTNIGNEPIYNWALKYDAGGEVTNIWNGVVFDNAGTKYIIKNAGYNYELLPNASVNFGYTLKGNKLTVPNNFENCAKRLYITDGYNVQLIVEDKWENGFTGYIEVVNVSDKPLEAWNLSINTNFTINNLWNANMSQSSNNSYTVSSQIMSNPIQPNTSVKIGISANISNNVIPTITNSTMSIVQIDNTNLNGNNEDNKDDIIINDSDDLVGTIYFKDISSMDDLIFDSEGNYYVRNQILLTAYNEVSFETVSALAESMNAKIVGYIQLTNDYQIEFKNDLSIEQLINTVNELSSNPIVELATTNSAYQSVCDSFPNDTEIQPTPPSTIDKKNWSLYAINAPEAWDYYTNPKLGITTSSVKIGVIDLNFYEGYKDELNFFKQPWNNPAKLDYDESHGTSVAGIIAANFNNKEGMSGICPKTELYGFNVSPSKGRGGTEISNIEDDNWTDVMKDKYALALMIGNNVKVINISIGYGTPGLAKGCLGTVSIDHMLNKLLNMGYDFVIINSAGNETIDAINNHYYTQIDKNSPVYDHIIIVGAISHKKDGGDYEKFKMNPIDGNVSLEYEFASFSNYGNRVDIVAPGEHIVTTDIINGVYNEDFGGTSGAAPQVAGVAGLVYSVNPNLTGDQVKEIIINSASKSAANDSKRLIRKRVKDGQNINHDYFYPLLDAKAAVDEAISRRVNGPQVYIPIARDYAIVYGDVSDTLGTHIEKSKILVTSKNTSKQQIFNADYDGSYILTLDPGTYDIKFSTGSEGPLGGWFLGKDYAYHTVKNKSIFANDAYPLDVKLDNNTVKSVGVFDSNGHPIDYIVVKVTNVNSNEKYEKTINRDGILHGGVDDGTYTIDLTKDGYLPKTLEVEVKDNTIFDENGNKLEKIVLEPLESTVSGIVYEFNKTTKITKPLSGIEVAVYKESDPGSVVASTTTSSDGTYSITIKDQGDYIVKFRNEKQESISVSGGDYSVNATFEVEDKIPLEDDDDENDEDIDIENINLNFDGNNSTSYTGTLTGDLTNGIWFTTDKGYYINVYTTDTTGKYSHSLVSNGWGASTSSTNNWAHELKIATYNSKGNIIKDKKLDYFYQNHSIYGKYIDYDTYKIMVITSINFTPTGINYTMHTDGYYSSHSNFIGSISYRKGTWEKDEVSTVKFYNKSKITSVSTEKPF